MHLLIASFIFITGALIGSFLSLVAYRWPKDLSIIKPASYCDSCKKPLRWRNNIPLFAWFITKGKCNFCQNKFSIQSTIIEWFSALLLLFIYLKFGLSISSLIIMITALVLLLNAEIDYNEKILPDLLNLIVLTLGVLFNIYGMTHNVIYFADYKEMVLGGILGFLVFYIINFIYKLIRKTDGVGMGDMKLLGALGVFFGYQSLYILFNLSVIFALFSIMIIMVLSIFNKKISIEKVIAFGPAIIASSYAFIFFSNFFYETLNIYLHIQ